MWWFILLYLISYSSAGPLRWIEKQSLLPESYRYYTDLGFMAGSLSFGTIYQFQANNSNSNSNLTANEFFSNPKLLSSTAFEIDFERNILFICHHYPNIFYLITEGEAPPPSNWSLALGFMSGVMIVDLETKQIIQNFDLQHYNADPNKPMYHMANDITIASNGNAYVTDSFGGAIYRISYTYYFNGTYKMDVFGYKPEWLVSESKSNIFFDGISLIDQSDNMSFLLANCWLNSDSFIWKIPFGFGFGYEPYQVNYTNIAAIQQGFDGQVFSKNGQYLYVTNSYSTNYVYQFITNDNWNSMSLSQSKKTQYPTPVAVQIADKEDTVYVLSARGFDFSVSAYPIEEFDFSRNITTIYNNITVNKTIIINNTCNDSSGDADGTNDMKKADRNDKIIIYCLAGVCVALLIGLMIAAVYAHRMKKRVAHFGSNLDYQNF